MITLLLFPFIDVGIIAHVLAVPLLVAPSSNMPSVNLHPGRVADNTEFVLLIKMRKKDPSLQAESSGSLQQALGLPLIKSGSHPGFIGTKNFIGNNYTLYTIGYYWF